jgi:5-bromo-4-chloroindolyl phosphate hydrolysis protein
LGGEGGWNHVIGGVLAAIAVPAMVFGFNLPFIAAIPIALSLYAGSVLLFTKRRTIDRVDPNRVGQAQAELVASLIEDGETVIARLKLAAQKLQSKDAAGKASHMAEIARSILDRLAAEPDKLSAVRRFLTYYMPRSAEIAEGMVVVETQRSPDRKRLGEIADIMGKLDHAFTFYSDSFAQAELDTLDVELRLLSRSLTEDVAPAVADTRSTNERAS